MPSRRWFWVLAIALVIAVLFWWSQGAPPNEQSRQGGFVDAPARESATAPAPAARVPAADQPGVPESGSEPRSESEEPPELAVTGVVLGFDGQPVAGARVNLHWINPADRDDQRNLGVPTRHDGTFTLEPPGAGPGSVVAALDGAFSRRRTIEAGARDVVLRFELRWITVRGSVVDSAGRPVAGALAWRSPSGEGGRVGARSEMDGAFLHRLREPGTYEFVAKMNGYLPSERIVLELTSGQELDGLVLRLRAGESVSGRVVDAKGAPIAGAAVRVATDAFERMHAFRAGAGGEERWPNEPPAARTDDDGAFVITGLSAGTRFDLFAFKPGFSPPAEVGFTPRFASGQTDIELVLHRLAVFAGTVRGPEGEPLAGTRLRLAHLERPTRTGIQNLADSFGARHETVSATDGAFRFESLLPGPHVLQVEADQHVPPPREEITLLDGEQRLGHEVWLQRATTLRGRVLDTAGSPIPRARVEISNFEADPGRRMRVQADGQGRFTITDARPGVVYQAWAKADGFRVRAGDESGVSATAGSIVDLVLERAHSVQGVVRAVGGGELSSLAVTPVDAGGKPGSGTHGSGPARLEWAFHVRQVEPDLALLRVAAEGFVPREIPASFAPGEWDLDVGVIELHGDGASLTGQVRTPSGAPLEDARVSMAGMRFPRCKTGADGRYRLAPLPRGQHQVIVRHQSYPVLHAAVHVDGERAEFRHDLQLREGGTLSGLLTLPGGKPRSSRRVRARPLAPDGVAGSASSGRDGRYSLPLAPGRYQVSVVRWRHGQEQVIVPERPIDIELGRDTQLDLVLPE